MVTLRPREKRKAEEPSASAPATKKASKAKKAAGPGKAAKGPESAKPDDHVKKPTKTGPAAPPAKSPPQGQSPAVGDHIKLEDFEGEIETQDGEKTSLKALLEKSETGLVLFTYPKASTPGCTRQACAFRDNFDDITGHGWAVYGLSADKPAANKKFKEKQQLQYELLCDPDFALIGKIGKKKQPSGIVRGVFVVDKAGLVLINTAGSPDHTVTVVKKLLGETATETKADG